MPKSDRFERPWSFRSFLREDTLIVFGIVVGGACTTAGLYLLSRTVPFHWMVWLTYLSPLWAGFLIGDAYRVDQIHWAKMRAIRGHHFDRCPVYRDLDI